MNNAEARAFDARPRGLQVSTLSVVPPLSGPACTVTRGLSVGPADWQKAIDVATPDTPANASVRRVGAQYTPPDKWEVRDFTLVTFPTDIVYSPAHVLYWADRTNECKLPPQDPYALFALAAHEPNLRRELRGKMEEILTIISSVPCTFENKPCVIGVSWYPDDIRVANVYWLDALFGEGDWALFGPAPLEVS